MKGKQQIFWRMALGLVLLLGTSQFTATAQKKKDKGNAEGVPQEISDNDKLEAEYYFIEGEKYFKNGW